MTPQPTSPRTAAGRALLAYFPEIAHHGTVESVADGILAIEAEAVAAAEARVTELESFLTDDDPYARVKKADALLLALVTMLDDDAEHSVEEMRELDIAYENHLSACRKYLDR